MQALVCVGLITPVLRMPWTSAGALRVKILHCLKHENHKLYINGKVIKCADRKPTEVR